MAAFNRKVNYTNNLMKSTFKKGLVTEIMQAITHEVIGKNEIVYINFLFLNLSNIFLILFTNFGHECILKLQRYGGSLHLSKISAILGNFALKANL